MTPVETLTAAVALYEQRREGVTEGPYVQNGGNGVHTEVGACVATTHSHNDARRKADAVRIASWSPSVTDPVVQAWRALLADIELWESRKHLMPGGEGFIWSSTERAVLASATAYLAGAA